MEWALNYFFFNRLFPANECMVEKVVHVKISVLSWFKCDIKVFIMRSGAPESEFAWAASILVHMYAFVLFGHIIFVPLYIFYHLPFLSFFFFVLLFACVNFFLVFTLFTQRKKNSSETSSTNAVFQCIVYVSCRVPRTSNWCILQLIRHGVIFLSNYSKVLKFTSARVEFFETFTVIFFFFRRNRYCAYRHFTCWIYGIIGRHNRKVHPSCVVNAIREVFPSPTYTGFKDATDL